ncbi:signal transduction histidine kinase [Deinobacterium chartae]|uniref:histidine kinase n=1 Tax=Deinobacterium chartae TaxID=521158 RepID=A0A841I0W6_9DEIO|nr:HAMP domain-containing sensor histidine kinase [Deinobacterium chartae]MBB6098080.1 signal transduction histidine kinase [Deinobacterium chartae]
MTEFRTLGALRPAGRSGGVRSYLLGTLAALILAQGALLMIFGDALLPVLAHGLGSLTEVCQSLALRTLLWSGGLTLLFTAGIAVGMSALLTRPIQRLEAHLEALRGGDYRARSPQGGPRELRALADGLNDLAARLETSERARGALVSDLQHEVATPLASLRGYLEGLEDGVFRDDPEVWAACTRQLERLEVLLGDLSQLSAAEAGVSLRAAPLEAQALMQAAARSAAPLFARKGVILECLPVPSELWVHADAARVEQVLANLLSNALRHTPPGGRVRLQAAWDAGTVRFEVADAGEGIPREHLSRIFERFYRVDPSRSRASGGSGIGLTITRHLVEAHGGHIGVASEPGQGSRFWFTLPAPAGLNQVSAP